MNSPQGRSVTILARLVSTQMDNVFAHPPGGVCFPLGTDQKSYGGEFSSSMNFLSFNVSLERIFFCQDVVHEYFFFLDVTLN